MGEAVFGIVQILAHLVSRVSRPQFCWGLAILCDPPFFSGYIEFGGVVVKFYSSVEITLHLLADFLLQYVTLFQSRDIVKNLVSLLTDVELPSPMVNQLGWGTIVRYGLYCAHAR